MSASAFGELTVIADPRAGGGRVAGELPALERALARRDLPYTLHQAEAPGDAARFAREALVQGRRYLVAVGGDGTVQDVLNGMFEDGRPLAEEAILGVVAANSGCDIVKSFGLPGDTEGACDHLAGTNTYPFDVVKIACAGPDGERLVRYSHNLAEVGFGAAVARRAASLPAWAGRARLFLGFWVTLVATRLVEVEVEADRKSYQGPAWNVIVANAQFTSGGLRVSPRSFPGDGILDALVFGGPRSDAITMLPRIYRHGGHVPDPYIHEMRAKIRVAVNAERRLPIQADGEPLGMTPATFTILPQAISFKL